MISGNGDSGIWITNGNYGIWITGEGTSGNVIVGNTIGTDITGTLALPNAEAGGQVDNGAAYNTIGGLTTSDGVFDGFAFASTSSSAELTVQSDLSGLAGPQ